MLWVGLGLLYIVLVFTIGLMALRKGHWVMFILGFVFPLFWLIGAVIGPTEAAARQVSPGST